MSGAASEPFTLRGVIPVRYLLPSGLVTADTIKGEPCIQLKVSFQKPTPVQGGFWVGGLIPVIALIDTGAEWNLVDKTLVALHGSPAIETLVNHGIVGSALITNHAVTLHLAEASMNHQTGAATVDLSGRAVPWQMILGRKFLQIARFTYDHAAGIKEIGI